MKKLTIALMLGCLGCLAVGTMPFAGCHSSTGTLSRAPVAFLKVVGDKEGLTAHVDDLSPVAVTGKSKGSTIQVSPGKHRIKIFYRNELVVDRVVLVSDDQTMEISVP
jgi:hypothetical protein